jgi:hypothetical protein
VGGALRRAQPGHGALAALDASYVMFGVGMAPDPTTHERLGVLTRALAPWDSGRRYLNFADRPTDPAAFFDAETHARLRAVKAAVDPGDLFRSNHPV